MNATLWVAIMKYRTGLLAPWFLVLSSASIVQAHENGGYWECGAQVGQLSYSVVFPRGTVSEMISSPRSGRYAVKLDQTRSSPEGLIGFIAFGNPTSATRNAQGYALEIPVQSGWKLRNQVGPIEVDADGHPTLPPGGALCNHYTLQIHGDPEGKQGFDSKLLWECGPTRPRSVDMRCSLEHPGPGA